MTSNYTGGHIDDSRKFDDELVENVVHQMKKGKSADLDGITVEHLCCSNGMLPCILSELFNLCMTVSYVVTGGNVGTTVEHSDSGKNNSIRFDSIRNLIKLTLVQ